MDDDIEPTLPHPPPFFDNDKIAEATDALANMSVKRNPNDGAYSMDLSRSKFAIIDQDLDDWSVGLHLAERGTSQQEEALKPSPHTRTANKDAWEHMDHYTRDKQSRVVV